MLIEYSLTDKRRKGKHQGMHRLPYKSNEYEYKERDRRLKDKFINGISDGDMITEIIKELTVIKRPM